MTPRVRAGYLPAQSEAAFQQAVIQYARHNAWHVWAPPPNRPGKTGKGPPPIIGVVGGWPDLALWRITPDGDGLADPRVIGDFLLAELKTEKGRLTSVQTATIEQLRDCGLEVHVWRPSSWPLIEARLARRY